MEKSLFPQFGGHEEDVVANDCCIRSVASINHNISSQAILKIYLFAMLLPINISLGK